MLFVVAFLLGAFSASSSALEVEICSRDTCQSKLRKPCPVPNELLSGERHHLTTGGLDCFCFCGLQEGVNCESDAECDVNTRCMYETHVHPEFTKPACVSRCSMMTCMPEHRCEMTDGQPKCIPIDFKCSQKLKTPVIAIQDPQQEDDLVTKTFQNDCFRVMENKKLELKGSDFRWVHIME
ncbi:hypothetical protein CAPTEDRAFT_226158 [Capitella teleta]|uniref:VWFC domain-containing protein n=1 Tax=Capitella teleta TaxID=283909 RepID=R7TLU6_CAPTE|nr:hypothetical protein CAPTEDRAFT_226158 [Capitella teleta]|eukprot:ELT94788.1 hypothetical protein CAPTEDRAFT_226158 [Capitella teleta]